MPIPYRPIAAGLIMLLLAIGCGQAEPSATPVLPANTSTPPTPSPIPPTAAAAPPTDTPVPTPSPTPQPLPELREMIDVGGYQLYIHCTGMGTPTVIMEAGYGDVGETWSLVQPQVARFTQACSYDRAGLGLSEPGPEPRNSLQIVNDLHTLLGNANIEGSLVLVGHSMGGLYMRLYADRYREDVVGLVLVDSAHPDQFRRQAAVLPPESPDDSESLRFYRDWFTNAPDDPTLNPVLFEAGSLGNMPLVVLTAPNKERAADFPAELNAKFNEIWVELQEELTQLSSNSTHVISDKSQHFIQRDQPELVVDAIRQVVSAVSTPTPPTLTHALSPEPAALPYDAVQDLPFVADGDPAQILTIHLQDEENRGKPALWVQGGKQWQQPVAVDPSLRHRCASRTCKQREMP